MDFHDAVALLTVPGQPFELERITIPSSTIGDLVRGASHDQAFEIQLLTDYVRGAYR